ncbi:hypothetical protein KX816_10055 [Sphingosinicellaceae bacterium]|nr:hypothetical protein KX816_10055 [Sphingosinicellaceae bacterium]
MVDGEAFGLSVVKAVRGYVDAQTAALRLELRAALDRVGDLEGQVRALTDHATRPQPRP